MMNATEHTARNSAKRFGDWCVGGRQYAINPTPTEALV